MSSPDWGTSISEFTQKDEISWLNVEIYYPNKELRGDKEDVYYRLKVFDTEEVPYEERNGIFGGVGYECRKLLEKEGENIGKYWLDGGIACQGIEVYDLCWKPDDLDRYYEISLGKESEEDENEVLWMKVYDFDIEDFEEYFKNPEITELKVILPDSSKYPKIIWNPKILDWTYHHQYPYLQLKWTKCDIFQ